MLGGNEVGKLNKGINYYFLGRVRSCSRIKIQEKSVNVLFVAFLFFFCSVLRYGVAKVVY